MSTDVKKTYADQGYYLARAVFTPKEVEAIREHFMQLRAQGPKPGDAGGDPRTATDPLNKYPRMINMHNWDEKTAAWMKDPRLVSLAETLVGEPLELCQTMLYFKPPGARGQAKHQDNQYIRKFPLVGAWLALDECSEANGYMVMIPGSNQLGILPVQPADLSTSFTNGESTVPANAAAERGIEMDAGDVLFFSGFTIHGSYPNQTKDQFRRAFIVHYLAKNARTLPEDPATMMSAVGKGKSAVLA